MASNKFLNIPYCKINIPFIFMPPPFEEWWRGIKCYPCPCVHPSIIKIWCPLNNFKKTASIHFKFGMLIYNIKTQVEFDLGYNPLIVLTKHNQCDIIMVDCDNTLVCQKIETNNCFKTLFKATHILLLFSNMIMYINNTIVSYTVK